jgi:hypothetical protein
MIHSRLCTSLLAGRGKRKYAAQAVHNTCDAARVFPVPTKFPSHAAVAISVTAFKGSEKPS